MLLKRKENKKTKVNKFNIKDKRSQLIIVGSLLIIGGLSLVGGKYLYNYLQNRQEDNMIQNFYEIQEQIDDTNEDTPTESNEVQEEKKEISVSNEEYIAVNGAEYKYKVVNMYDIEKTGTANIIRNANKSTLTLVTCRHNTNKQIIIICELVEKA